MANYALVVVIVVLSCPSFIHFRTYVREMAYCDDQRYCFDILAIYFTLPIVGMLGVAAVSDFGNLSFSFFVLALPAAYGMWVTIRLLQTRCPQRISVLTLEARIMFTYLSVVSVFVHGCVLLSGVFSLAQWVCVFVPFSVVNALFYAACYRRIARIVHSESPSFKL